MLQKIKIDVYSIMRNEIKILPYFLRHYEQFANRIFVWDDQSDDGTTEMLVKHPKVVLLGLDKHGTDDGYFVTSLWPQYRKISRGCGIDWVICVDADEFVYHKNLISVLDECKRNNKRKIRCAGYTMFASKFPTTSGQIYDEIKIGLGDKWSSKTILFDPEIDVSFTSGRHQCLHSNSHPTYRDTGIMLLHFRHLGQEYYIERDKRNCISMKLPYKERKAHNLPDGTRGTPIWWYAKNKHKATKVVD
jgi:hypothetical protein